MSLTYSEATDAIFNRFRSKWLTDTPTIVGNVPTIVWQGVEPPRGLPIDDYWCRLSIQTVLEQQGALNAVANPNNRLYTVKGVLFVQLFCPMAKADAMQKGRELAMVARNAFRGYDVPGEVWFTNVTINELKPEDTMYRFNVAADFTYNDIG